MLAEGQSRTVIHNKQKLYATCIEAHAQDYIRRLPYLDGFLKVVPLRRSRSRSAAEACTSLTVKSQSACSASPTFSLCAAFHSMTWVACIPLGLIRHLVSELMPFKPCIKPQQGV